MKTSFKKLLSRILGIGFVLLLATFVIWRIWLAHAVNTRLAALHAAGLPTTWAELNAYYPAVPDAENAALVMAQAFGLMQNYPDEHALKLFKINYWSSLDLLSPEQRQLIDGYVAMNSNALAKASEAIRLRRSRYPVNFLAGPETPLPHLDSLKKLAWLWKYQANLAITDHQPKAADASVTSTLGLAQTLIAEPNLISQFARISMIWMGFKTLEDRFNAGELDDAELADMASFFNRQSESHETVNVLAGQLALYIPIFRTSFVNLNRMTVYRDDEPFTPLSLEPSVFTQATGIMERDLLFFLTAMETNIALADLPPPQNMAMRITGGEMSETARRKYCILSGMLLPGLGAWPKREAEGFTYLRLARTAVAIERFRHAQGRLPNHLDELASKFIAAVPTDPFDGQPLRYHLLEKGYVIYSVGADGQDDGGREKPSADKPTCDISFTVKR